MRILVVAALLLGVPAQAHYQPSLFPANVADREPDQHYNVPEEAFIHTPPGFKQAGLPLVADASGSALLDVQIVEAATGKPTFCRVNVVGADGNYYEPDAGPLVSWSRRYAPKRETHGPSRYFGWYFYTNGTFSVRVPAGKTRIEVWKGYEFRPTQRTVDAVAGAGNRARVELERSVRMADLNYYSGDTHIHLNRRNQEDEQRALDLLAAEGVEYGFLLAMNNPDYYVGEMGAQIWPQDFTLGRAAELFRDGYGLVSGQEYRSRTYGHICLLMNDRLVLAGKSTNPNNWPVFGMIAQMTRDLGGYSFLAHGGYSQEIFADFIQKTTDGVELLQLSHYRGIGLQGWYRILNIGVRFPGLAGSDYPSGRALSDCRNYVYAPRRPDFTEWARGAAEGRSFFTTGPLLLLEVNGRRPGDTIELSKAGPQALSVRVRVRSEVAPVAFVDLVVNGENVRRYPVSADQAAGRWHEVTCELSLDQPSWIAARAHSLSATGRPDAEAHTNPVYVTMNGRTPYSAADLEWLLENLDRRIEELKERAAFPEKAQSLAFFQRSREILIKLRAEH